MLFFVELPSLSTAPSPDYKASMTADMEAIKTAIEALNDSNVKAFFDVITSCKGQILTSGVGERTGCDELMFHHITASCCFPCI